MYSNCLELAYILVNHKVLSLHLVIICFFFTVLRKNKNRIARYKLRIVKYKLWFWTLFSQIPISIMWFWVYILQFCFFFHHGIKDKKVIVTFQLTFMTFFSCNCAIASLYLTILLFTSKFAITFLVFYPVAETSSQTHLLIVFTVKFMKLKNIGFIDDKNINLVIVHLKLSVCLYRTNVWLTNMHHIHLFNYVKTWMGTDENSYAIQIHKS